MSVPGFSRDFSGREAPCIGVFGGEGTGKTRLCVTAGEWAKENGKTPGWIVSDRKTRKTVRETCSELELPLPFINEEDFVNRQEALSIATLDRETDHEKIARIYTGVYTKLLK